MAMNFNEWKNSLSAEDLMKIVKSMITPHDAWVALENKLWEEWGNEDNFTKWAEGDRLPGSGYWKSEW